ncbi:MAG: hypothetical protein AAFR90_11510 [Pseudomonadota bacterium]
MKVQSISTKAVLVAELSHILCCGLPIFIAIMSVGSQAGLGSVFITFHGLIHEYERFILGGSGLLIVFGLLSHYVSYQINCQTTGCKGVHEDCAPKKFRVGWIFTIAVVLYIANITFYVFSGHGAEMHRFG